jgi:glycerate-2-kinase
MFNPASPVGYLLTILDVHLRRARSEKGASAVEWVILRGALEGEAGDVGRKIQSQ